MGDAACEGSDRIRGSGSIGGVADFFAADGVLLVGEGQGSEGDGVEVREGAMEEVDGVGANPEFNVAESEWGGVIAGVGVFAGSQQEEEGDPDEVGGGPGLGGVDGVGKGVGKMEDRDGNGFDTARWWVLQLVGGVEPLKEDVDLAGRVLARVGSVVQ